MARACIGTETGGSCGTHLYWQRAVCSLRNGVQRPSQPAPVRSRVAAGAARRDGADVLTVACSASFRSLHAGLFAVTVAARMGADAAAALR